MPARNTPRSPGGGFDRIAIPSASETMNSSAPPNAPIGVQRPKITAARAMNPRLAVIPFWKERVALEGQPGAGQAGEDAAEDHVPVAQPDHVDADRVRGPGMLADGPRPQTPAGPEQQDLEDDHEDDDRHRDRPGRDRNILKIQPMSGRSRSSGGGRSD